MAFAYIFIGSFCGFLLAVFAYLLGGVSLPWALAIYAASGVLLSLLLVVLKFRRADRAKKHLRPSPQQPISS